MPYVFADNRLAPQLARRCHAQLMVRLPGQAGLPEPIVEPTLEQLGLL